jgi:hypothetical protein
MCDIKICKRDNTIIVLDDENNIIFHSKKDDSLDINIKTLRDIYGNIIFKHTQEYKRNGINCQMTGKNRACCSAVARMT